MYHVLRHYLRRFVLVILGLALAAASSVAAQPQPSAPSIIRYLYVVPMSHLDIGFNVSIPDLIPLQKAYLDDAMDYAEQFPDYHWTVESVWQLDQWAAQTEDPAEIDRMRALIEQGKISVMAGYANMHQGLLGSEELNRFLYPGRVYETKWGLDLETAMSNDVPGSSWALPQVLRANGVRNLVAGINTTFGGVPAIPIRDYLFNWQGVDGSKVLTWVSRKGYAEGIFNYWLTAGYPQMARNTQKMIDYYENNGYPYDAVIVMLGFDNDGPDTVLDALDNIERWNQEHEWPQILISTPDAFFQHVRDVYGDDGFTTYTGDWSGRWESNDTAVPVSTSQNRWIKDAAPQAETLAAVAQGLGANVAYPAAEFDRIYRDLLVYDEHSGPGGQYKLTAEGIEATNQWFRERTVSSLLATQKLLGNALTALARNIQASRPALVVYNGLSWPRSDLVTVSQSQLSQAAGGELGSGGWQLVDLTSGEVVPTQLNADGSGFTFLAKDVPPVGYRLYGIEKGTNGPAAATTVAVNQIENEAYRVEVDPATGDITTIYDKRNGRELVNDNGEHGFNRLVSADQSEATIWGVVHDVPTGPVQVSAEIGPVTSRLIVTRDESPLRQTVITLPAGLPRVEIRNTLDHDRTQYAPHQVQTYWYFVTMPFALGDSGFTGRFQGPNGWLIPQQDWIPGTQHNTRVSRHGTDIRAADGFGVTLANRESYLSSFGSAGFWDADEPDAPLLFLNLFARTDEAFTSDTGWVPFETWEPGAPRIYEFNFALTSTGGMDPVAAEQFSGGFNSPLLVAGVARQPNGRLPGPSGSLIVTSHPNVTVTTLKRADFENPDGGDLILRLQEIAGRPATNVTVTVPFALEWAELNGVGEQRTGAVSVPVNPLLVDLTPYQTLTLRLRPAR